MTSIKDFENALFDAVCSKIAIYGFTGNKKDRCFYKGTEFGRLAFCLAFIRHPHNVDLTVQMAVRFDELENLINEDNNHLSNSLKRSTFSIGIELGNLLERRPKRWTVASLEDVETVAQSIMESFEVAGLPYLEKYSDMRTALYTLSRDDRSAWLHSPFHDVRAKRAIGLAFLLRDREQFARLAEAKSAFLKERNDLGLASFLQFKDALDHRLKTSN